MCRMPCTSVLLMFLCPLKYLTESDSYTVFFTAAYFVLRPGASLIILPAFKAKEIRGSFAFQPLRHDCFGVLVQASVYLTRDETCF